MRWTTPSLPFWKKTSKDIENFGGRCPLPPEQQVMARMMQVLPAVQEIQQNALEKYGFNFPGGAMQAMMQIQVASQSDPDMAAKVKQLMSITKATLTACSNSMLHNF